MDDPSAPPVDWTVARRAAYRRIHRLVEAFLADEVPPEEFERSFLQERHAVIDASRNGGQEADYDLEEVIDEIWFHVDDYVPTSMGVERAADQIDETEFFARVRTEWERYLGQRES